jgi:hypothetical protein
MNVTESLKHVTIELGHAIMEHRKANAPQVIIDELVAAWDHLASAIDILDRSDE